MSQAFMSSNAIHPTNCNIRTMTSRDNAEEPHHKDPLGNLTEPLLSLTPAQEGHVRVYLDEQLASLSRDQRKQ